ncbi:MAG: hypothetical protein HFF84_04705 [Oscillibacter sp.]|nr:hypothetical protein [Oscillibacter sp.]
MSNERKLAAEREGTFAKSLIVFLVCVAEIMVGIVILGLDANIPIIGAAGIAIIYGMTLGIPCSDLQGAMVKSVIDTVKAIMVLLMIGPMIAAWMACGTVPYIIYLGLGLPNPSIFLLFSVTGSSWTTIGTIGVAFIGIAMGLNIPAPAAAGAIVCGAYFGDKCSPISDIVVLNSGITKVDIYKHCMNTLYTTVPALIVTLRIFGVIGIGHTNGSVDQAAVDTVRNGLASAYKFSPILWVPFIALITSVILKLPSIPALLIGALASIVVAVFYQGLDAGTVLSRTVSDGGICFAPMVPWGSNGVFCSQTLGIRVGAYVPYYFMGFLTPIFAIVCAVTGAGIQYAVDSLTRRTGIRLPSNIREFVKLQ